MRDLRWSLAALVAALLLPSVVARAQGPAASGTSAPQASDLEAHRLFEQGRDAFAEGEFEQALESFRHAYGLSHRPALLFNIGAAADCLRRTDEALDAFERYLRQVPDAPNRHEVEARVRILHEQSARERTLAERPRPVTIIEAPPARHSGGVLSTWWFWTVVGAVVVGGVVTAIALTSGSPAPIQGDNGVFAALRMQ